MEALSNTIASKPDTGGHLASLNAAQRAAVEAVDGPVLVLAGAGTGKTRVLTTRIAHILKQKKAFPGQILAVTFTNKAAREMKERVGRLLDPPQGGEESLAETPRWLGTFHSIGARMLRRHAEMLGFTPTFTILDADDQHRLIKQIQAEMEMDDKRFPGKVCQALIQKLKDKAIPPEKASNMPEAGYADGKLLELYGIYQRRLKTLNAMDFGDLLLHTIALFQQTPEVLQEYSLRFRYILVDEYQDTNVAQYLWLRLLAGGHKNICCVGDDDQSIYGWRGAEVGNILRFEKDFPGAEVIRLECNYRSTSHILGAASGLIANNAGRLGKTLFTETEGGEKLGVKAVWDDQEEARFVGDEVESLQRQGEKLDQMAILVRAGFQTRAFEERFMTLGVPYRVVGGLRFYERQEIRDAIAYIRATLEPRDSLAFERIVNVPKRGIGKATMQQLQAVAREREISLQQAAAQILEEGGFKPSVEKTLGKLLVQFGRWRGLLDHLPHTEVVELVMEESGYREMWNQDKSPEAPGRIENLRELMRALEEFDDLTQFLEHVGLVSDNEQINNVGDAPEMVNIMTLHAAKGLEFDTVFLPGWEEGLFPSQRSIDENGKAGLEEERRLAYVGITRARQRLYIVHAANRRVYGNWQSSIPSRFLEEIPGEHVEALDEGLHKRAKTIEWENDVDAILEGRLRSSLPPGGEPAKSAPSQGRSKGDISPGTRVSHAKFGSGLVVGKQGDRLDIIFDRGGMKKVLSRFVETV